MTSPLCLAYGREQIEFDFKQPLDILMTSDPVKCMDPARLGRRLKTFMAQAALDLHQPAVVVADKTRLCGYPQYLPVLLDTLVAWGADPARITIYVAYGTHARQSEADSCRAYGPVYGHYRWVHHQCEASDLFVTLGRTRQGTPVRMRQDIMTASCLITFGAIVHHYFAGYGGGRKLVFPGLGEKAAIYANHGLFLDRRQRCLATGCQPGVLQGNPLAEDLSAYEAFRPADMAIHGILDSNGQVCDLLVGCGHALFQEACARHAAHCEMDLPACYDLVLASGGGFPKDVNFIQSHKAVHNAAAFVRDGGQLIVLAQCRDGIGSQTFLPWFDLEGWDIAFDRLAADYVGNGGTALAMMAKLQRIRISLVTALDHATTDRMGIERLSAEQARQIAAGHDGTMAVIPNAGVLVKKTQPTA